MTDNTPDPQGVTTVGGCFLRVYWAMMGPALVGVVALVMALEKTRIGSSLDFVYVGGVIALVIARFMDRARPDPSSPSHGDIGNITPRKYMTWVLVAAVNVYVAAHFVGAKLR